MGDSVGIARFSVPAGESGGAVDGETYRLLMADNHANHLEWSVNGGPRHSRGRVFSGDIWVWPKAQTWWVRQESDQAWIQLSLSSEWFRRAIHASPDPLPQMHLRDVFLAQLLRTLAGTAQALPQNPTTALYRESLATTLALHLVTHHGHTVTTRGAVVPLAPARLRAVSDHIAEHLAEPIALADLAQLTGLRVSQFSLRFREATGQTPYRFVTAARVDRARELLIAGHHTLADVARLTGFADQSHLTRHVRRILGVTPGALKRR